MLFASVYFFGGIRGELYVLWNLLMICDAF